jgi:opacity protein-like surface antigen
MAPVKPYVGAGLNYAHSSYSATILGVSGSNTANNTGLNVLGGARFHPTPKLDMFGEVRLELRSGSPLVFTVGLLF